MPAPLLVVGTTAWGEARRVDRQTYLQESVRQVAWVSERSVWPGLAGRIDPEPLQVLVNAPPALPPLQRSPGREHRV